MNHISLVCAHKQAFKRIELLRLCRSPIALDEPLGRNRATAGRERNIHLHKLRLALALLVAVCYLKLGHAGHMVLHLREGGELLGAVIMFTERVDAWSACDMRGPRDPESMRLALRELHLSGSEL